LPRLIEVKYFPKYLTKTSDFTSYQGYLSSDMTLRSPTT